MRAGLADRVVQWSVGVAAGTAVLVAGTAVITDALLPSAHGWGVAVAGALAVVAAPLLAGLLVRPHVERLRELAAQVRELADGDLTAGWLAEIDAAEFADLSHGVNLVLARVRREHEALRDQAELGRSLLQVSPNGVLVTDASGLIRFVNPAFTALVPPRAATVEGRRPIEVVPVAEVQAVVDQLIAGQDAPDVDCVSGPYDLLVRGARCGDAGAMVVIHDVTGFRDAERARTDFVSNVSHELRTPIASILGWSETLLLEEGRLDADLLSMARAIHRSAERLRDLFEELLRLSRIEARRGALPMEERRLLPLLADACAVAADLAAETGQTFSLDCLASVRARVNPEALSSIVSNLAVNAAKYTPPGGHVGVVVEPRGDTVVVRVEDDGIGIDPSHQDRIFERFYRVDSGRARKVGGTGLGLAIAKHLAMAMGSRLDVRSEVGRGSTFTLSLPRGFEE